MTASTIALLDPSRLWPVSPFVRRRWRRRLGLPDRFVAEVGGPTAPALDERTTYETLFLCAAAVVDAGHLVPALALGTPVVCGSDAATALGAVDGEHVLVADDAAAAREAADELAGDDARAATLARAGRRLVTERDDSVAATRRGTEDLGVDVTGATSPAARIADALVELGTPPGSEVTSRLRSPFASLGPATATAAPLPDDASARRVAAAFGLPAPAPSTGATRGSTPGSAPTIRQQMAGKTIAQIARAAARRALRILRIGP